MSTDVKTLAYKFTVAAEDDKKFFVPQDDLTLARYAKHAQPLDIISPGMEDPDLYALIERNGEIIDCAKTIWVHGDSAFYRGLKGTYDRYKEEQPASPLHTYLEAKYFEVGDTVELVEKFPKKFFRMEP